MSYAESLFGTFAEYLNPEENSKEVKREKTKKLVSLLRHAGEMGWRVDVMGVVRAPIIEKTNLASGKTYSLEDVTLSSTKQRKPQDFRNAEIVSANESSLVVFPMRLDTSLGIIERGDSNANPLQTIVFRPGAQRLFLDSIIEMSWHTPVSVASIDARAEEVK